MSTGAAPGKTVRIGMIGTSWWADTMYMPAFSTCAAAEVVAICGHDRAKTDAYAARWGVAAAFTDYQELIRGGRCDAVVIATPNDTHHPIAMEALNTGLHVLCEKPLALNYAQASEMAALAASNGLITCVPFTYRHMPSTRYLKSLIDGGYLGRPYHMDLRYYAAYGRTAGRYLWRFDRKLAGSGALGDIGSHFLHIAEWLYGEVEAVCAQLSTFVDHGPVNAQGQPYEQADDSAMVMLRFKNGAQGIVHSSAVAYERTYGVKSRGDDQVQEWDFHGSEGTLRQVIDWDYRQEIIGDRAGDGPRRVLTIPDEFWGGARREVVTETFEDVFRKEGHMVHDFVYAVVEGRPVQPDFAAGARTQRLVDAAIASAESGCWVKTL